jgi:hypothetical protein
MGPEKLVVLLAHVLGEDIGRLAAQLQSDRDDVLRRVLHDQSPRRGLRAWPA